MQDDKEMMFELPGGEWQLSFSETCIRVLEKHAQRRWYQTEAVGQLFTGDLTGATIRIETATVLKPRMASRASVTIDPDEAMAQRRDLLAKGYYCIGLWHTHPANTCGPSGQDRRLACDHALAARSVLNGLVFVIVGGRPFPDGWYIGVHDGTEFHRGGWIDSELNPYRATRS